MRLLASLFLASLFTFHSSFAQAKEQPNVIYILADDLGYGDLGCYGQKKLKTPNIDRLAKEGMQFTDHYSGNTVCSPSRAVLMTGQHPGHVHCRGNGNEQSAALDPDMTTLPRLFKNAGYVTGAYGKWGLGQTSDEGAVNPMTHGFDHFSGWKNQGVAHTYYPTSIIRDGKEVPLKEGTYIHDLIMDDAFAFIKANAKSEKPFFCYIPTAVPHAAMHAPAELHEKWRKVYPQFDKVIAKYGAPKGEPCPPVQNPVAGFAGMMENLDHQIGQLLDMLVELGINDNTIVMFSSDNGAHHAGGHKPEFWDSNGPLRGLKRDLYEGGIRAPFLARWPAKIEAGSHSDHISAFWDVLPTMAELIGQPVPEQSDGLSFLPAMLGKEAQPKHDYLYHEFIRVRNKEFTARSLRMGDWKAVQLRNQKTQELNPIELYNLKDDLGETTNLAANQPELVAKIEGLMDQAHTPRGKGAAKKKAAVSLKPMEAAETIQPNILWIVTEDIGCDMASYGTKGVHTPHIDQLAAEGALYTRAYTTASICSPSRSSFMTGLYPHQVFSKNMRIREPLKQKALPEGVDIFTKYLRDAGYAIGFPGHGKKDWGFLDPKTDPYDTTDWDALTQQQPFFCQYQFYDTHRVNKKINGEFFPFLPCPEQPVDRAKIDLHPYTPETPEAREELGAYLENINLLDIKIGKLIADLKAKGLYENTIIVLMGDNGPPIFRGKGFLYERGILMPLIVRVPEQFKMNIKPGTQTDELVSALDMAPTFIDLAGGKIPDYMEGRIFFGPNKQPEPKHLFAMRDRHDMNVDRVRSVSSKTHKYIRNYVHPMTCFENSLGNVAASKAGKKLFDQGKLPAHQSPYFKDKPEEELYDLENDPFELYNLAQDPVQEERIARFQATLAKWEQQTGDDGKFEDPEALKEMHRLFNEVKRARQTK